MLSTVSSRVAPLPTRDPQPQPQPPAQPPQQEPWPEGDSYVFNFPSQEPQMLQEVVYDLPKDKAPHLPRPVILVHGYNAGPDTWDNMANWLTRDGANTSGGVVRPGETTPINHDANVFEIQFSRPYNSVCTNAAELRTVIDRVAAATGNAEVDVVAHSMGGLDARHYLDKGDEKIKKLVMIATPNHGAVLADIELTFRDLGVPILPPFQDADVRKALTDLSEVRKDGSKENNPLLAQMNNDWERQRGRAETFTISGNGTPTLANRFLLTFRGDGVVAQKSCKMDKTPNHNVWRTNHSSVKDHPTTLKLTADFLTGKPMPLNDEGQEPPDVPADQEFVPRKVTANSEQLNYEITVTNNRDGNHPQ